MKHQQKLFVIAGPTASGKSQFAIDLACKIDGEIINADAIQVYSEMPILTAAPSAYDQAVIKHHLYNYIPVTDHYSVGKYIENAIATIHEVTARNKVPILVGGTGMYIKSLCYGMHDIPDISPEIRANVREKFQKLGNIEFYKALKDLDPIGAEMLHESDSQRLMRFYEISLQTGRSITEFYKEKPKLLLENYDIKTIILDPEREYLYERCNKRFIQMLEQGALDEVEHISSLYGAQKTAAEKVIGFNELAMYLKGEISKDEAIILAQTRTRQYAKRQVTWFKHQINDAMRISFSEKLPLIEDIII